MAQERFLADGGSDPDGGAATWHVPVTLVSNGGTVNRTALPDGLMKTKTATIEASQLGSSSGSGSWTKVCLSLSLSLFALN